MVRFLETQRQQAVRLLAAVKFLQKRKAQALPRLRSAEQLLLKHETAYTSTAQTLFDLANTQDSHFYPIWDMSSALHVLTTGSYRLLPKAIEQALNISKPVRHNFPLRFRARHDHCSTRLFPPSSYSICLSFFFSPLSLISLLFCST